MSEVKLVQGEPWPLERADISSCCLNYGDDHPRLVVFGGLDKDATKVLTDMWILDVDGGKWTEVRMAKDSSYTCTPS